MPHHRPRGGQLGSSRVSNLVTAFYLDFVLFSVHTCLVDQCHVVIFPTSPASKRDCCQYRQEQHQQHQQHQQQPEWKQWRLGLQTPSHRRREARTLLGRGAKQWNGVGKETGIGFCVCLSGIRSGPDQSLCRKGYHKVGEWRPIPPWDTHTRFIREDGGG